MEIFTGIGTVGKSLIEGVADSLGTTTQNVNLSGVTVMEIANQGDLDGFINKMHKTEFEQFGEQTNLSNDGDRALMDSINDFFNNMMEQIMKPLDILHSSKYAFIHGDMKSKNIFVHKDENDNIIYKLADFDKSSITYNGVRFHNKGGKAIQAVKKLFAKSMAYNDDAAREEEARINRMRAIPGLGNLNNERLEGVAQINDIVANIDEVRENVSNKFNERVGDYYTLSGAIVNLSRYGVLQRLEKIEVEQLSVRYLPIPFYQTIDIYTFICSLFFSKLFYIFIKKCEDLHESDNNHEFLNNNKIYKTFKSLFEERTDRVTMIKYFEIYYKTNNIEEVSINAILDPLKKIILNYLKGILWNLVNYLI